MSTQHIAILLGAICCARLVVLLGGAATCQGVVSSNLAIFNFEPTTPNMSQLAATCGQTRAECCAQQCCIMANEYMKEHIFEHANLWLKKFSGLRGIRTHDLCDTGAVLYQLSYQAIWELVTLWVQSEHPRTFHMGVPPSIYPWEVPRSWFVGVVWIFFTPKRNQF